MDDALTDEKIALLAKMVRDIYGLKFLSDRWNDLRSAVGKVSSEIGKFKSSAECLDYLLSPCVGGKELELFINQLTIGETYFFRDPTTLEALEHEVLPKLSGRGSGRFGAVRIWSMACATGEEPYTLAMMCRRSHVLSEIFGTDIDSEALAKACEGSYRKWSFRIESSNFKSVYFKPDGPHSFQIDSSVKDMVHFSRLNLIGDSQPLSLVGMDVVLCRNVLIYFSEDGVKQVLEKVWQSLNYGGWLVVTPSESALITAYGKFEPVNIGSVLIFRKTKDYSAKKYDETLNSFYEKKFGENDDLSVSPDYDEDLSLDTVGYSLNEPAENYIFTDTSDSYNSDSDDDLPTNSTDQISVNHIEAAYIFREKGDNAAALNLLNKALDENLPRSAQAVVQLTIAEIKADSGYLDEAVYWCEKSIAADRVAPEPHFLLGQIRLNQGDLCAALNATRNAVFLDNSLIMGHFVLGNIYMSQHDNSAAMRHFRISLQELRKIDKGAIVPHSDGNTAGRFIEMIEVLINNIC